MTDKCKDRWMAEKNSEIATLRALWEGYQTGDEEKAEEFYTHGLCFDYVAANTFRDQDEGYYRYQISWGGPSDEFRFFRDGRIEYWFMDWFDGHGEELTGSDRELMGGDQKLL